MKIFLIVAVFALCVCTGYYFSSKYLKRKKFFSSLIVFAEKLSLEINFSRERLRVLIDNFDKANKKDLMGIDEKFALYLSRECELTIDDIFGKNKLLKQDEKELILLFFKALGRSDVENQTKEIQNFVNRFSEYKEKSDAEQKKYGALAMKLGIVAGLFWAVLIV